MLASAQRTPASNVVVRSGFDWRAADAYLFDIDGTLLNSRDAVHYFAFHTAIESVWKTKQRIDDVPVHGNTDIGILRAVAERAGVDEQTFTSSLPRICELMSSEVERNHADLRPQLCEAIPELIAELHAQGKILGVATGNLEAIGWAKLRACGLRHYFHFGAFSAPDRERRAAVFRYGVERAREVKGEDAIVYAVGDTPSDIAAAREVGIPIISVATGNYSFEELHALAPDMIVRCCEHLPRP